jgi:hypothetical protein
MGRSTTSNSYHISEDRLKAKVNPIIDEALLPD